VIWILASAQAGLAALGILFIASGKGSLPAGLGLLALPPVLALLGSKGKERGERKLLLRAGLPAAGAGAGILLGTLLQRILGPGIAALPLAAEGLAGPGDAADMTAWLLRLPGILGFMLGAELARASGGWRWERDAVKEHSKERPPDSVRPGKADLVICIDEETGRPVVLQEEARTMHMLVAGPTRSGKTFSVLHPCLAQDLARPEVGITVIEPKGDWVGLPDEELPEGAAPGALALAERFGRKVYLIDPTRPDTDVFNPLAGDINQVIEANVAAFNVIFGKQEAFFAHVEATVLKNMIRLLKYLYGDRVTYLDLMTCLRSQEKVQELVGELADVCGVGYAPPRMRDGRVEEQGALGGLDPAADPRHELLDWFVHDYFHRSAAAQWREHSLGLRTLLDKLFANQDFLRCVIPRPGARTVDLDRHLEEASVLLVPTNDGVLGELSQVLGALVTMHLQFAIMRRGSYEFVRSGRRRPLHALYIDEFGTYIGPRFVELLEKGGGMGVFCALGFQSIGQLEKIGGRHFRDIIIDNTGTKVVFGRLGPEDVRFWSQVFGTREAEEESFSEVWRRDGPTVVPDGVTIHRQVRKAEKPLFGFNEIRFLEENRVLYEIVSGRTALRARRGITRMLGPEDIPPRGAGRSRRQQILEEAPREAFVRAISPEPEPALLEALRAVGAEASLSEREAVRPSGPGGEGEESGRKPEEPAPPTEGPDLFPEEVASGLYDGPEGEWAE